MAHRASAIVAVLTVTGALFVAVEAAGASDAPRPPAVSVKWSKLSADLARVLRAQRDGGRGLAVARSTGVQVLGARVRVVVEARGARSAAASVVISLDGKVEASHANLVQALVTPLALARLSSSAAVSYVRTPRRAVVTG